MPVEKWCTPRESTGLQDVEPLALHRLREVMIRWVLYEVKSAKIRAVRLAAWFSIRKSQMGKTSGSSDPAGHESGASSDLLLVQRVQKGEKGAFDLLVRKYQHKIFALVSRFVRNPQEAEDVAQEAFLKAYRALPNFRGESAFYTWLYRIAVNTAKNHLVAQSRQVVLADVDSEDAEQFAGADGLREYDTPEGLLLGRELAEHIDAALSALPEDLRMAVTLREFEGLSYDEIAQAMDCPVGTVRSRIFRAREAIGKALSPLLERKLS